MNRHINNKFEGDKNKLRLPLTQKTKSQNKKMFPFKQVEKKEVKHNIAPTQGQGINAQKQYKQHFSVLQILDKTIKLTIQEEDFDLCWSKFVDVIGKYFNVKIIFLEPVNANGQSLLKEGSFILNWLKIIKRNSYINIKIVAKKIRQSYLDKVQNQKSYLISFLDQIDPPNSQTPLKIQRKNQSLKKSILKNSSKKVQFGNDEIIYPTLHSYVGGQIQEQKSRQQRIQQIKWKRAFILDYFQINDILLLEQVQIIGILKEFDQVYTILQVKKKQTGEETTCIGIRNLDQNQELSHSLKILQAIQKEYQHLDYLQLEGRGSDQVWINSLSDQRLL